MSSIPRAAQRVTQEHVGATPLKHLSLTHSARPIAEALKRRDVFCTGITTLKLRNLSFDVLRDAAYFAQMKSLHSLTLEDIMLTEQDVLAISRTPVSTLTLKNCPGADNLLGVLAESRHLGDLRFLDISRVNVSLSSFLKFLRTADAPGLRSVHVASNAQDQTLGDGDYIMLKDAFNRGILGKQLHTVSFSHIKHLGMLKFTRGSYHRSTQ